MPKKLVFAAAAVYTNVIDVGVAAVPNVSIDEAVAPLIRPTTCFEKTGVVSTVDEVTTAAPRAKIVRALA